MYIIELYDRWNNQIGTELLYRFLQFEMTFTNSFHVWGLLRPRVHPLKWSLGLFVEAYCKTTSNTRSRYSPSNFPKNLTLFTKVAVPWREGNTRLWGLLQTVSLLIHTMFPHGTFVRALAPVYCTVHPLGLNFVIFLNLNWHETLSNW